MYASDPRRSVMTARKPELDRHPKATPEEVAAYLQVPVGTLYQWRHKGYGPPAVRIGKHLRYTWSDVDAWWAAQVAQQSA
ncbi:helix-turn-helix transcriptional regulator [Streptomyces sp. NPDC057011]|uniref:helix-turn-helix transcriptional regulator n=1 Tax=unclassified Streptomyces TaxID=2593676 RepID=UPI003627FF97